MTALEVYRDDGVLARLLAGAVGRGRPGSLVPPLLTAVAAVPLLAVVFSPSPPTSLLGAAVGGFALLGACAGASQHGGRLDWVVPPMLRAVEYTVLLRLAALAGGTALPVCFGALAALAFHHYDVVYRLRHQGAPPPLWVQLGGGGWELRLLVAYGLAVTGLLVPGLAAIASVLGVVFVAESVVSWLRFSRVRRAARYEDEEDEE
jgi:hypothetical protein